MTLKLYGIAASTCTMRVRTILNELDITDYEIISLSLPEMKAPEHLARQPFGRIPVLDDDGFILCESRAICKYLAKKYAGQGTELMPADNDVKAYGLFEKACSYESFYFDHPASSIGYEMVFKGAHGKGPADEALMAKYKIDLEDTLRVYDRILAKQAYLAGDELTLADLFHLSYGKMIRDLGFGPSFEQFPHVEKWFRGLETRKSFASLTTTMQFFAQRKAPEEAKAAEANGN